MKNLITKMSISATPVWINMIQLVICDVDGVLTDGKINVGESGELFKSFSVKDGLGIVRWMERGGEFAIITSRTSDVVRHRAEELGVETVHQGVEDKVATIEEIAAKRDVVLEEVAYIGDDDSDVSAIKRVGVGVTPADASKAARRAADYVCSREGGDLAVREFLENFNKQSLEVIGVIPARYGSTRFPGKPLADIAGKPMIQHVYERATKSEELDDVVVATDDKRIVKTVEEIDGKAVMTDPDLPTGTDRVAAVAREAEYDITVNIQGDEPLIDPEVIDATVVALRQNPSRMATPVSVVENSRFLDDPNTVKVVTDADGQALYFSRSRIPSEAEAEETLKHIGLYAFETDLLLEYVDMNSTLEPLEDLEQLRLLENGYDIQTVRVDYDSKEVNVEEDVAEVESLLEDNNDI